MVLNILMGLALLTVFGTLVMGVLHIGKTDTASQLKSNKLMRLRVVAQAVAVGILALSMYLKSKTGT
ncbi:MAG: hypothetical protein COA69_10020 [Robiginitomaculum sp.]|nr:MAG: hypothetical protein COA69_10020 [Robiginitomaculum sp.]